MTPSEWRSLAAAVNADIRGMSIAIAVRNQVRRELGRRQANPTEEFFIDQDAFGAEPTAPRTFEVMGTTVQVWKTHRAGLRCSDIKGADLYYEVSDQKFLLVQYKSPDLRGRVRLDDDQLTELEDACPTRCPPSNRFACGSWYAIRSSGGAKYFPGCEAREVFGAAASRSEKFFVNGLTQARFREDFGLCRIGARAKPIDVSQYKAWSVSHDRVYVSAVSSRGGRGGRG